MVNQPTFGNYKVSWILDDILEKDSRGRKVRSFLYNYFKKSKHFDDSNLSAELKIYSIDKLYLETRSKIKANPSIPLNVKTHALNLIKADHNNYLRKMEKRDKRGLIRDAKGYDSSGRWLKEKSSTIRTDTYDTEKWQLVPKEPTEEMGKASRLYWRNHAQIEVGAITQWGIKAWEKILEAAPKYVQA